MGRTETIRYGPRIIDMDILFYDDLELKTNDLEIPHPRIQERNFVLKPLCEYHSFFFSFFLQLIYFILYLFFFQKKKVSQNHWNIQNYKRLHFNFFHTSEIKSIFFSFLFPFSFFFFPLTHFIITSPVKS